MNEEQFVALVAELNLIKAALSWVMSALSITVHEKTNEVRDTPIPIGDLKAMNMRTEQIKFFQQMALSGDAIFNLLQIELK